MPKNTEQIIIALIAGTIVLLLLGAFIFFFVLFYQKRHNRYVQDMKSLRVEYEQELLKTQLEIQEQTLNHVSQEIHDNLGQMLSVVKVQIGSISSPDLAIKEKIDNSFRLLTRVIQDLRNLSRHLNGDYIHEKGFIECLQEELDEVEKTGAYQVQFILEGESFTISAQRELILYRMVQEIINNVLKHAHGTRLGVHVKWKDEELVIRVTDNGVGFDYNKLAREGSKSLGLLNLQKRASLLGGTIRIQSGRAEGTDVLLTIPSEESFTITKKQKTIDAQN